MSKPKELPMVHYHVYAIQHNATGRIYVGITKDIKTRINAHFTSLKGGYHSNPMLQADFNEFGDDLTVFSLEEFEYPQYPYGDPRRTEWQKREKEWMIRLGTYYPRIGYNCNDVHFRFKPREYEIVDAVPIPNKL